MANLLFSEQENHKDLILALLSDKRSDQADFVPGKGQARVVLLHGQLKRQIRLQRLTVSQVARELARHTQLASFTSSQFITLLLTSIECLSRQSKRPMLSLTVADLGNKEEHMEERLSTWFRLAENWNAIMLIDEADVFLEERKAGHLQRNCLIAGMICQILN